MSLAPALMMPLPLVGPISLLRPCSPVPADFPGFVHALHTCLEKLTILLETLLWSPGETARPLGQLWR